MIEKDVIKISGKEYIIKRNWESLDMFETITGKNIDEVTGSVGELLTSFYCIVKSNNEYNKSRYEFLKEIDSDENEGCVEQFSNYLNKLRVNNIEEDKSDKKKVKRNLK